MVICLILVFLSFYNVCISLNMCFVSISFAFLFICLDSDYFLYDSFCIVLSSINLSLILSDSHLFLCYCSVNEFSF